MSDVYVTIINFLSSRFKLSKTILANLRKNGYDTPTPIQMQGIPILMKVQYLYSCVIIHILYQLSLNHITYIYISFQKREFLACAPTGSGKTLAFILPLLHHLKVSPRSIHVLKVIVSQALLNNC